jgi:hypothetical protein
VRVGPPPGCRRRGISGLASLGLTAPHTLDSHHSSAPGTRPPSREPICSSVHGQTINHMCASSSEGISSQSDHCSLNRPPRRLIIVEAPEDDRRLDRRPERSRTRGIFRAEPGGTPNPRRYDLSPNCQLSYKAVRTAGHPLLVSADEANGAQTEYMVPHDGQIQLEGVQRNCPRLAPQQLNNSQAASRLAVRRSLIRCVVSTPTANPGKRPGERV